MINKAKIDLSSKIPFHTSFDNFRTNNLLSGVSSNKRFLLLVLTQVVVIGVISLSLVMSQVSRITEIRNNNKILIEKNNKLSSKLNELGSYNRGEIESLYGKVMEAIPGDNYYLDQFKIIRQFASQTGVEIVEMQANPGVVEIPEIKNTKSDNQLNGLVVNAKIRGNMSSMKDWANLIETSLPLSEVKEFDFDTKFSSSSADLSYGIEADVEIVSYWSLLPSYLGKIESVVSKLDKVDYETIALLDGYKTTMAVSNPTGETQYNGEVGRDNPFP